MVRMKNLTIYVNPSSEIDNNMRTQVDIDEVGIRIGNVEIFGIWSDMERIADAINAGLQEKNLGKFCKKVTQDN